MGMDIRLGVHLLSHPEFLGLDPVGREPELRTWWEAGISLNWAHLHPQSF